jgi:hypothetical protein
MTKRVKLPDLKLLLLRPEICENPDVTKEEIILNIDTIHGFRVIDKVESQDTYKVAFIDKSGAEYTYIFQYVDKDTLRLFYHSEISSEIRNNGLVKYIADEIMDSL